jgi:ABC-type Fe3+ transport system permease subunit
MLRPTGFETLATRLWSRTEVEAFGAAAPYALGLIALAAIPAWLLSRWLGRRSPGSVAGQDGDMVAASMTARAEVPA